jgi:hypothetical protein
MYSCYDSIYVLESTSSPPKNPISSNFASKQFQESLKSSSSGFLDALNFNPSASVTSSLNPIASASTSANSSTNPNASTSINLNLNLSASANNPSTSPNPKASADTSSKAPEIYQSICGEFEGNVNRERKLLVRRGILSFHLYLLRHSLGTYIYVYVCTSVYLYIFTYICEYICIIQSLNFSFF